MKELLEVDERVKEFPMWLEDCIAREKPGCGGEDPMAPEPAGGSL